MTLFSLLPFAAATFSLLLAAASLLLRAPGGWTSRRRPASWRASSRQWDARKGARQLYEAFSANGLALDEFEGPQHRRITQIKQLLDLRAARTRPALENGIRI